MSADVPTRPARWRGLRRVLAAVATGYLGLCAVVFLLQDRLVFLPGPPPSRTPADRGLEFESVRLAVDGEALDLWWIPSLTRPPRGVVVFCHGNAGSIEHRIGAAGAWVRRGFDVALFDYRGYGASEGTPSEAGLFADARAVHAFATTERGHDPRRVLAYGRSLGGAVAIDLAAERQVGGVVVESTFTSLPDVGATAYPFLPVRLLSRFAFDSASKIERIDAPLLLAHGPDDAVVPFAWGAALFERAREPKEFVRLEGGHNDAGIEGTAAARAALDEWLERTWPQR